MPDGIGGANYLFNLGIGGPNNSGNVNQTERVFTQTGSGTVIQNISITDAICEGPVAGLVNGTGSIYFDDVPVKDAKYLGYIPPQGVLGSAIDPSTRIAFSGKNGTLSSGSTLPDYMIDTSTGDYYATGKSIILFDYLFVDDLDITSTVRDANNQVRITADAANNLSGDIQRWITLNDENSRAFLVAADAGSVMGGQTVYAIANTIIFEPKNPYVAIYPQKYKLFIAKKFALASIPNNKSVVTENEPQPGNYIFSITSSLQFNFEEESQIELPDEVTVDDAPNYLLPDEKDAWVDYYNRQSGGWRTAGNFLKVEGLYSQERRGYLIQEPLSEVGTVGAAVVTEGNLGGITTDLKILAPDPNNPTLSDYGKNTNESITIFDIHGLPNIDPENGYVNRTGLGQLELNAHTVNNPTDIPSSAFANNAKINEMDQISLMITYPQGLHTMNQEDGSLLTCYAIYKFRIKFTTNGITGPWVDLFGNSVRHWGRTRAGISYEHIIDLESFRPFDTFVLQVARQTRSAGLPVYSTGRSAGSEDDKTDYYTVAESVISKIQCVIKDKFTYPYTALVNTIFNSKQYNKAPRRTYEMRGMLVKIPESYTPREYSHTGKAEYENFWGGNFKKVLHYTDNPAWCFYDIVTNNRYGAGQYISEFDIDKYSLYRIARYCDELVGTGKIAGFTSFKTGEFYRIKTTGAIPWTDIGAPDGNVGTEFRYIRPTDSAPSDMEGTAELLEPRYRMNVLLTKPIEIYKVLKDMATNFASIIYWLDGQISLVQDVPSDPVYNFTKANVIDGRFAYEGTPENTKFNQIIVTWNDPAANYELVPLLIEDKSDIAKTGQIRTKEVVAFGCTSESQAIRMGKWKLWTAQNQREVVTFKTSFGSAFIRPGDVITVQDGDRYGISYGGRLSSGGTLNSLVLDREITFNSTSDYEMYLVITEPAAFYTGAQSIAINGTTYNTNDRIPEAYVFNGKDYILTSLDSESKASNAFSSSAGDTLLQMSWHSATYVQKVDITNPGTVTTSSINLASSLDKVPRANLIWSIREINSDGAEILGSAKTYKVLDIAKESKNIFAVTAVEHYNQKFGEIEKEYDLGAIPPSAYAEKEPDVIPSVKNLHASFEGPQATPFSEILLSWDRPENDEWISHFEIVHTADTVVSPVTTTEKSINFPGFD
jgi:hypothetical protein